MRAPFSRRRISIIKCISISCLREAGKRGKERRARFDALLNVPFDLLTTSSVFRIFDLGHRSRSINSRIMKIKHFRDSEDGDDMRV